MKIKEYQDHIKKMKEDPEYKKKYIEDFKIKQKENFANIKPFNKIEDIPNLPVVDKEEWDNYYVPILISKGAIPKKDLIDGQWYIGDHRRCKIAKWDANKNVFVYVREKFGQKYLDTCNHFQDDDGFALFVPIKKAEKLEIDNVRKNFDGI